MANKPSKKTMTTLLVVAGAAVVGYYVGTNKIPSTISPSSPTSSGGCTGYGGLTGNMIVGDSIPPSTTAIPPVF